VVVRPARAEKLRACDYPGRDNTRTVIGGGVLGERDCWLDSGLSIGVTVSAAGAQDLLYWVIQSSREEAILVGRESQYLCTLEIKPVPSIPASSRYLCVSLLPVSGAYKPLFRLRR
jgi:hypothetical protein